MEEPILDYVKRRLQEHKGEWAIISRDTDVDYSVVVRIAQGINTNPTITNVQPLVDWFAAKDTMLEQLRSRASA